MNDPRKSIDKGLILDRFSLLEAELRWFSCSLSFYIKQEIELGVRSGIHARIRSYFENATSLFPKQLVQTMRLRKHVGMPAKFSGLNFLPAF